MRIRAFDAGDAAALAAIFRRAVMEGAAAHYDEAQRRAWCGRGDEAPGWQARLGGQITLVAERDGVPRGFMTLGRDGYLDLAFVLPEAMGTGVAAALHDRILAEALDLGLTSIETDASLPARSFFRRQGWREVRRQEVRVGDVALVNFRMEKRLAPRSAAGRPP